MGKSEVEDRLDRKCQEAGEDKKYVLVIEGNMREEANQRKTNKSEATSRLPFARPAVPNYD
jgi:hypothetical protein